MKLSADYHTHTTFSHGKGSIIDNAVSAKNAGIKVLGITDHGFSHPAFGIRPRKIKAMQEQIKIAKDQTGVDVLLGIESNIIGIDGTIDIKPKHYDQFDLIIAGLHKFVLYKPYTYVALFFPNFFREKILSGKPSKSLIERNTKTYINVIKNNPVDIISHINFGAFSNPVEVAKVARDYNTRIELNAKKTHITDEELYEMANTGVHFVINSDAHSPNRVGEISLVLKQLERVNVKKEQIDNVDGKIPKLRFAQFKEGKK